MAKQIMINELEKGCLVTITETQKPEKTKPNTFQAPVPPGYDPTNTVVLQYAFTTNNEVAAFILGQLTQ